MSEAESVTGSSLRPAYAATRAHLGIVAVLFQGREFTAQDVNQTAVAVIGYAIGLLGLIGVKILAPGFYAQKDIRTPVKIAVFVLIATQLANLVLVPWPACASTGP